ncbi:sulfonate ABC transporter substrate-binding protein [Metabacillus sp. RGM 3146]|uniref:sulfonate ABC transporter substrate-binding protein n=1 Tax=Metabacillus sp. RGM 3146 TaxID=3401092 RepID=UPI003B9A6395
MVVKKHSYALFALAAFMLLAACQANDEKAAGTAGGKEIRIGYQKFGTLNILKAQGNLDQALKKQGYSVKWAEFPAGPQLLEALNVGSIDFGHTGEAPPVFAQAAKAPLVYAGNEPSNPKGEAIVVPKDSKIKSLEDLKGKKIALNKGSNVHYLLVKALEKAHLKPEDVKTVYLPPSDALGAFQRGSVDAWVIWDPFLANAEEKLGVKIVQDGEGLVANREFLLANKTFAAEHPDIQKTIFAELRKTDQWVQDNPKKAAEFLSPQINISVSALEKTINRRKYGLEEIKPEVLAQQQKIADSFYNLKLIPVKIDVNEAAESKK